jgi:hypothetical protein
MRIEHTTKARKSPGTCGACGKVIAAGEGYKSIKGRYTSRSVRHEACPDWKPSEMTGSDKLGRLYAAREQIEDALESFDGEDASDLRDALENAESEASDVASEYNDAAEACAAIREQCEEYASSAENFGSECGSADIEDFDEDAVRDEIESEMRGDADDDTETPELISNSTGAFLANLYGYMAPYRRTFIKPVTSTGLSEPGADGWQHYEKKTEMQPVEDWSYGLGPCSEIRRDEACADLDALARVIASMPKASRRAQWQRFQEFFSDAVSRRKLGRTIRDYYQQGRHTAVYEAALVAQKEASDSEEPEFTAEQQAEIDRQIEAKREEWADEVRSATQTAIDALDL